ncbi:hypothetical protein ABZT26_25755 [Streptomyces sp. NPDC005395]|uniref:hypothetical protein n=1 Tax=Streptomyces sp. NPDC005395 TaxID=3157042 RepID=UPI0033BA4982
MTTAMAPVDPAPPADPASLIEVPPAAAAQPLPEPAVTEPAASDPEVPFPADCWAAIEEASGQPVTWAEQTDRAGCSVWRVTGPRAEWAVKYGRDQGAAVVAREAAVMRRIAGLAPATSYGKRALAGQSKHEAWLMTPWLDGPSMWDVFMPVRLQTGDYTGCREAAADACLALGALHAAGWVHGDIQPHHVLYTAGGARLIDWSWAWHPGMPPSSAYDGGLVHLMSPELMDQVESGARPVATSPADEVWALAASIWWAATADFPRDYRSAAVDPAAFTPVELRRVLLRHQVKMGHIEPWKSLEEVLRSVLASPPGVRPDAVQLGQQIKALGT